MAAQDGYERALRRARETGNRNAEASGVLNLGLALWSLGSFAEALEHFDHAFDLAREIGDPGIEGASLGNRGICLFSMGRWAEAEVCLQGDFEQSRDSGNPRWYVGALIARLTGLFRR